MTIFLTSDTHFGHARIIELCGRPFSSVEEMDEALIENWNKTVGPRDEVYHLGDFAFRTTNMVRYFDRLNGKKHLIIGNHDNDETAECGWLDVQHYVSFKLNKQRIVLFHYPIAEWEGYYRGSLHAHGHQHNKLLVTAERETKPARFDVGVDACRFTPIPAEALLLAAELGGEVRG
jgi:calcineurin-like phosphoesterase family protein